MAIGRQKPSLQPTPNIVAKKAPRGAPGARPRLKKFSHKIAMLYLNPYIH